MSTFSSSNYTSADYAKYRPTYPELFFHYILKNAKVTSLQSLTILDIGCGPGTCFTTLIPELINILKDETNPLREVKLIASDLSQTMLNEAERKITPLLDNVKEIEVKYLQGKAEEVGKHIAEHSIDLVIAAECIHWVDAERFLNGIHQILKEGATLAYWAYSDSVFIKVGDANGKTLDNLNHVHDDFVYGGEGKLGRYWEQPGRERLRKLYVNVNEIVEKDTEHWDGVIKCIRDPSQGNAQTIGGADEEALKMQMTLPFSAYLKYADTWSAAFRWNESHSEEQRASRVFHDVLNKVVNIDYDEEVTIEMRTVYMIAHSK